MKHKRPNTSESYDVSALHSKKRRFPVNLADGLFQKINIECHRFPPNDESREIVPAKIKYSIIIDDSFVFLSINALDYFYFPLSICFF